MNVQNSFEKEHLPALYIVPTPIGNLEDITFRAIRILKEVDIIACEDTRVTKKLCHTYEIQTKLISYHLQNEKLVRDKIISYLEDGKRVALVSDAGTPLISDPGNELVQSVVQLGIPVIPLPGANAALTLYAAMGFSGKFHFIGFLPRQKKELKLTLEALATYKDDLIFYESPHRILQTLESVVDVFGNREVGIGRELTKKFEQIIRGQFVEVITYLKDIEPRGEYCFVVRGNQNEMKENWDHLSLRDHVNEVMSDRKISEKEAMREVAEIRGISKREVYQEIHIHKK